MAEAAPKRSTAQLWVDMLAARSRGGARARILGGRKRAVQDREFYDGDLVPGTRYRVTALMGYGGMGTVYEVEHVELGRRFVLKALMRELARRQDLVQRLRNEWRALGRLEHPNIVNVTDAGTTPTGVPYYVMERLEGETLAARMRRARRLTVPEALAIASGVLEGLSAAHEIGVIHRDVKPPNIFLLHDERPKVLDFGVAKIADAANVVTARGMAVGTPRYMSPEQARGIQVDGRSDIYAVGLLLFEMIAGVGPFDDARDAHEMLLAHLGREAPRLSSVAMGVLSELDETVAAVLAKDPRQRPGSARELAALLRAIARDYSARISTTGPTPVAGYAATTAQVVPDAATRDLTTRPEGVVTGMTSASSFTQSTAVSPPPSWQLTDAPSSGELPTVARLQGLPLPPDAYAQSSSHVSVLPATTLLDPTRTGMTAQAGGLATSTPKRAAPSTARLGSADPIGRDRAAGDPTERLPEAFASGAAVETRTRRPAAEPTTLATPIPVVPSANDPPTHRRGLISVVLLALLATALLGWLLAAPAKRTSASAPAPAQVPLAAAMLSVTRPAATARASALGVEPRVAPPPPSARAVPTAAATPVPAKVRPPKVAAPPEKARERPALPPAPPESQLPASGL